MQRNAWNVASLTALLAVIASCHGDATAPHTGAPFQVDVRVVDDLGRASPGSEASVTVWKAHGAAWLSSRLVDSAGGARWQDTFAEGVVVDSVTIRASASLCDGAQPRRAQRTQRWSDSLNVTLTLPSLPRVSLQAGTEYCGPGIGIFGTTTPSGFWVYFLVESIGDSIRGKWQIDYNESRRTDYGPFSGVARAGEVRLQLRPDHLTGVCDTRADLVLKLDQAGVIESGHLENDGGCILYEHPFEVTAYDNPYFP